MELEEKELYVSPTIEVVEVKVEGSLCLGSDQEGRGNGFTGWD
jgi:hypothetical protein